MNIKIEQLKKVFPKTKNLENYIQYINDYCEKYDINTLPRVQQFIAQVGHESGGLSVFTENLNYSAAGLLKVFPKYFNNSNVNEYARKPEKIANRTYANRLGNGNEASGDGWKYRGRGAIQCTGKSNYKLMTKNLGVDFVNNPDLLATPQYAIESACSWWKTHNLNEKADINTENGFKQITRTINGGYNGLSDRINIWNLTKKYITNEIFSDEKKNDIIEVEEPNIETPIEKPITEENNIVKEEPNKKCFLSKLFSLLFFWIK